MNALLLVVCPVIWSIGPVQTGVSGIHSDGKQTNKVVSKQGQEIARLQKRLVELHAEVWRLSAQLKAKDEELLSGEVQIARLKGNVSSLRALKMPDAVKEVRADAAEKLRSYFWFLDDSMVASGELSRNSELVALQLVHAALADWMEGNDDRHAFGDIASKWLDGRIEVLRGETVIIEREPERESEHSEDDRKPISVSPRAFCGRLSWKTRGERAKVEALVLGVKVSWKGIVVETVDEMRAPYQLEVESDGVVVFVDIARKRLGALAGIAVGDDVRVEGVIADIGDTIGACASVLVKQCKVKELDCFGSEKRRVKKRKLRQK